MTDQFKFWILAINASKLKIFTSNQLAYKINNDLTLLQEITHVESRFKNNELENDKPGRYKIDASSDGSAYENTISAKELEKHNFAKEIAIILDNASKAKKFKWLIIATPDHFYGVLKKYLDIKIQESIHTVIQKDYCNLDNVEFGQIIVDFVNKGK